jgi:hypothetical protein
MICRPSAEPRVVELRRMHGPGMATCSIPGEHSRENDATPVAMIGWLSQLL